MDSTLNGCGDGARARLEVQTMTLVHGENHTRLWVAQTSRLARLNVEESMNAMEMHGYPGDERTTIRLAKRLQKS